MTEIFESECINPAVNPYIPNMEVANYWTSSKRMSPEAFHCSVYSYQGAVYRQSRKGGTAVLDGPGLGLSIRLS